jgi:hypothetical protein
VPDVRQLLHETGDAQPVPDIDLDALVGRLRSRRRRHVVGLAAAAVLVLVAAAGVVALARSSGGDRDGTIPPSGGGPHGDVVTVAPDAAAFLETYLTSPYLASRSLMVAPSAHVARGTELIATGTIEDVQARDLPGGSCADPGADPDPGCAEHWYLDVVVRVDEVLRGSVARGTTITLPLELRTTRAGGGAAPPTVAEEAAALVEVAPVGHRAIVFAKPDGDRWLPVDPAAVAVEDDEGFVPTLDPSTGQAVQVYRWDDYLAEVERAPFLASPD